MSIYRDSFNKIRLFSHKGYVGLVWYLVDTFFLFSIFVFLRSVIDFNIGELYPLYLLIGISMFNFFRKATTEALNTYREKEIGKSFSSLVYHAYSITVHIFYLHILEILGITFLMMYYGVSPLNVLPYLILIGCLSVFVILISSLLLVGRIYWDNIRQVWMLLLRGTFLVTPIFYSIPSENLFVLLNPIYQAIQTGREILMFGKIPVEFYGILGIALLVILIKRYSLSAPSFMK